MSEPTTPEKLAALERRLNLLETGTDIKFDAVHGMMKSTDNVTLILCLSMTCLAALVWVISRQTPVAS